MIIQPRGGGSPIACLGCLTIIIFLMIVASAVLILSLITAAIIMIGIAIYSLLMVIWRYWMTPQPRPFNAWPASRLEMTFDHGFWLIYKYSDIHLATSPLRIFMGSIIFSLVPTMGLAVLLQTFIPALSWILPLIGLGIGLLATTHLSRTPSWFAGDAIVEASLDEPIDLLTEDLLDQDW